MTFGKIHGMDGGRVQIADAFVDLLRGHGLDTFDRIMADADGEMMRSVPGRSTVRRVLRAADGREVTLYLKRYETEYLSRWDRCMRLLRLPGADDEAMHEWRMIHELRQHGFNTPVPVAVGQSRHRGVVTRSFLITEGIPNGEMGYQHVRDADPRARRILVDRLAALAGKFHREGFIHRDFYLYHIFVVDQDQGGDPRLYLIDLQRVMGPGEFNARWIIKDLAALGYTAQQVGVTRSQMMRFFLGYRQIQRLGRKDKRLARRVIDKMEWLKRRTPRYDAIWDRPGVRPAGV